VAVVAPAAERHAQASVAAIERNVRRALSAGGFDVGSGELPAARVLIADRVPRSLALDTPVWAIDTSPQSADVAIRSASAAAQRVPNQAVGIRVIVTGQSVAGRTTELRLEQDGLTVATARHAWTAAKESWTADLSYLPPSAASSTLTVHAVAFSGETLVENNAADVRVPALRDPVRVLIYDRTVTWPAVFIRRSLEGESAFAVASWQRASDGVVTRVGTPPDVVSESTLRPYDVVIVGGPEALSAREVATLAWFVEERGGVVLFVPERRPSGAYRRLIAASRFDERILEQPVRLAAAGGAALQVSEMLVARDLADDARPLATIGKAAEPVIFVGRRGAGAVIFTGALDAWRYRADQQGFVRFWTSVVIDAAAAVPPRLSVEVDPPLVRPGDPVSIRARLRPTEFRRTERAFTLAPIAARVVGPAAHVDAPIRLWPSVEAGLFEGEWVPPVEGVYDITVASGDARADVQLVSDTTVERGADSDPEGLALLSRASGGDAYPADRVERLVQQMRDALPRRVVEQTQHPMRSPWWLLPFAAAVCAEWTWRRVRGWR
jgi:hypothetical protein